MLRCAMARCTPQATVWPAEEQPWLEEATLAVYSGLAPSHHAAKRFMDGLLPASSIWTDISHADSLRHSPVDLPSQHRFYLADLVMCRVSPHVWHEGHDGCGVGATLDCGSMTQLDLTETQAGSRSGGMDAHRS